MEKPKYTSALIVGTGPGLSASLARRFAKNGLKVAIAARQTDKLAALATETKASVHKCNAADPADVAALFGAVEATNGAPDVVVYNASSRVRGSIVDLPPEDVKRAIEISAFGAFLVSQQAAKRMVPKGHGAIFLSGATAGVKGFALSATFAMGKFALRGPRPGDGARAFAQGHPRRAFRDRRWYPQRRAAGAGRPSRQPARSRRDRRDLLEHADAAPQRLEHGGRGAAVGREVLGGFHVPLPR